jgi:hypothetical protein
VRRALAQVAALSPVEALVLTQLAAGAVLCRLAIRSVPLPRLARLARALAERAPEGAAPPLARTLTRERLAELADLAARLTGRGSRCLVRSLLLFALLRGRGEEITLVVGMAGGAGGVRGHAWIERGRDVVGETLPAGAFTTFLRLDGGVAR